MESTIRTTTTTPALRRWFVLVLALLGITAAALPLGAGAAAGSDTLMPGETLRNEQAIRSSNGYEFVMQADGNAVIYKPTTTGRVAIWATNTPGRANSFLAMQTDGNLVLYSGSTPYWASGMKGAGTYLVMQTDGNLVMYRPNGTGGRTAVWASNTVQTGSPAPTGSIRSKIRDIALAESKKNVRETNGDNKPRYGGAGGQLAPYNINAAWCASFATWVWQNAGVGNPRMINCGNGGAGTIQNWAEKNTKFRALSTGPRVGDLILFGSRNNCQHVTIVVEVDSSGWVRTVGGNESNAVTYTSAWRNPSTIKYGSSPAYGYASPVKD